MIDYFILICIIAGFIIIAFKIRRSSSFVFLIVGIFVFGIIYPGIFKDINSEMNIFDSSEAADPTVTVTEPSVTKNVVKNTTIVNMTKINDGDLLKDNIDLGDS